MLTLSLSLTLTLTPTLTLTLTLALQAVASRAAQRVLARAPAGFGGGYARGHVLAGTSELGCVQVRRGDFASYCLLVEMRARADGDQAHPASCAPTARELAAELSAAEEQAGRPIAWFAATNDAAWLGAQQEPRPS